MLVLGVDCGAQRTGYGVIESDGGGHKLIASGVISTNVRDPFEARLHEIACGLREVIRRHAPAAAAVEQVFYAANVRTALKLAHVRGVALLAIAEAGLELGEYSPLEIKISVVGYGQAGKRQVQMMVQSLLGLDSMIESEDACDALAVAICHATHAVHALRGSKEPGQMKWCLAVALVHALRRPAGQAADVPRLYFSKSFPGSTPAYVAINVDKTGAGDYREDEHDDHPVRFQLSAAEVAAMFGLAAKLGYFDHPLESPLKVAFMGTKTFRFVDGAKKNEVKFNFSEDPAAQAWPIGSSASANPNNSSPTSKCPPSTTTWA